MRHHNSVFHDLLKRIPWSLFDRLVAEHEADRRVRRLSTKAQFIALLYGQLSGSISLREIVGGLESHSSRLYHLGASTAQRSTLADANARRPADVFCDLFAAMAASATRGLRRAIGEATYLIDSTSLKLSGKGSQWAHFSATACGAKAHIVYDANAERPVYAAITTANVNDITPAKHMPIEAGATYVFDLGYYDFTWWAHLDEAGGRIVTRLKSHTRLALIAELKVPGDSPILSDRIGLLPTRSAESRTASFPSPVREVRVSTQTGKILRILTNDLDAPATEIADLYKQRWAIELFFKWVKQTLKIKHFLGNSENAVRIQIAVALIAYILIRIAHQTQHQVDSILAFARLLRSNLFHYKRTDTLLKPPSKPKYDKRQLSFQIF